MKVICSGMPKTGTKTLCDALRFLGLKVYDFEEQCFFLSGPLGKLCNEGCTSAEIREMFKGVDAITDSPACLFWEEIYKAFPEALIVHTERANEEEYGKSYEKQYKVMRSNLFMRLLLTCSFTGRMCQRHFNNTIRVAFSHQGLHPLYESPMNANLAKLRYRQHNARVREAAPKDKILYFSLKDGWDPLCKFLKLPVPAREFPHRNKGGTVFQEAVEDSYTFRQIRKELSIMLIVLGALMAILVYYLAF